MGPRVDLTYIDSIMLAGDVFDSICLLPDNNASEAQLWIGGLLERCWRYNVVLFVLEGTPGHDRGQSKLFETLNGLRPPDKRAELHYIEDLRIVKSMGMNILFVPDEYRSDPMDTWECVLEELSRHGLEQVDMAIMHGFFDYQVPAGLTLPCHDSTNYQNIVKHFISINHWHIHSSFGKIIAPGSPERLRHGEEGAKGIVKCEIHLDDPSLSKATFVESKNTTFFKKIRVQGITLEQASDHVLEQIADCEPGSHFRVDSAEIEGMSGVVSAFKRKYPMFIWDFKQVKAKKTDVDVADELLNSTEYNTYVINESNIQDLLITELNKMDIPDLTPILDLFSDIRKGD